MTEKPLPDYIKAALETIQKAGGIIRTSEALKAKISPKTFYMLRDLGLIEEISRGVYYISEMSISDPDLVSITKRIPSGVICLISALSFHNITTEIPHRVYVAVPKGARTNRVEYPPVSVHHYSPESYSAGVEIHDIDGVQVKIYSVEKTLVDCFKFRNKIGMDVFLEAIQYYKERKRTRLAVIDEFAEICGVRTVMRPYIEPIPYK